MSGTLTGSCTVWVWSGDCLIKVHRNGLYFSKACSQVDKRISVAKKFSVLLPGFCCMAGFQDCGVYGTDPLSYICIGCMKHS